MNDHFIGDRPLINVIEKMDNSQAENASNPIMTLLQTTTNEPTSNQPTSPNIIVHRKSKSGTNPSSFAPLLNNSNPLLVYDFHFSDQT